MFSFQTLKFVPFSMGIELMLAEIVAADALAEIKQKKLTSITIINIIQIMTVPIQDIGHNINIKSLDSNINL